MSKKMAGRTLAAAGLVLTAAQAFAQYGGNEGQLSNFLNGSANWLITILGPGVFLLGVIWVGVSLAAGDQDALRKGGYVVGGGALIFLAPALLALVKRLAGGF
ncbi:MAG: TrbC/VirB2 family protein [Elusimicrobia bacterium]|nr:TrbC/VirB2 family protein [Elusimicrobiota bacterium]